MKKNKKGIIYSTNPDFEFEYEEEKKIPNKEQNLQVCIEKHRAGKVAVIIKNFIGSSNDLKALERMLKISCGVGGSSKNGQIIIQGDVRDKVMKILTKEGYYYKRVGG